jgi:D-alanyl-lipoteichoic acid acyltransferase DltB (MBOAT superfamily)
MVFTSLQFFAFLPVVLIVFTLMPARWRWVWLLVASWIFYGAAHPASLLYLGAVTLAVYALGRAIERTAGSRRVALLCIGIVGLAGSLIAFKFYDFAVAEIERLVRTNLQSNISLPRLGVSAPAGFSFYVFSALSCLIDVHLRRVSGKQHSVDTALYLAFFPKILAGPIERAPSFLSQLASRVSPNPAMIVLGLQLIGWGLFKKVVIADNLAPLVDRNFAIAAFAAPLELLISIYFFAFQIYCDFSGYTDIAIGIALLFGIHLMENFRRPYLSCSTAEFWSQRWHISLGRWFRDYLYIPLGGSRAGLPRQYANIMLVFLVSGLWHAGLGYGVGWTFIVWGALNGFYQCMGLATRPLWHRVGELWPGIAKSTSLTALRAIVTFHLIAITWVFFRAKSVGDAWLILKKIGARLADIPSLIASYPFTSEHVFGAAMILLLLGLELLDERKSVFERLAAAPRALRWSAYYLVIFGLLILGRWQVKEFIYMQF